MTGMATSSRELVPSHIRDIDLPPFDPLNRRGAELRAAGHHVISLGQALPFFAPPASALAAARAALDSPDVNAYATDPGLPSLRRVLAERLRTSLAIDCTRDDILITAGANHAFTLMLTTMVGAGDEVVLPAPFFTNHEMAVRAHGAVAIEAPVADRTTFDTTWEDIAPFLTSRTRMVALCTPSNPTGARLRPDEGRRIARELASRGIVFLSDETYMGFTYDGPHWSAGSVERWRENVIVLGTCSKSFGMMGWRVGYVVADQAICEQAVKVQDAMIICAPMIGQIAAEAAIRDRWEYPSTFRDELMQRRDVLARGVADISSLHWEPAGGALFGLVRVDGCYDSAALATELVEREHVITIPGAAFGRSGEGFLRMSFGAASVDDLTTAVDRLRTFFASQ
jgi:aspartate/methionine/tyrosine aminotransferase